MFNFIHFMKFMMNHFTWFDCYRFRRQHEQLRTVIVRVLRPSVVPRSQQPVGTPISEDNSESKTDSLDAADINAIEVWHEKMLNFICNVQISWFWIPKILENGVTFTCWVSSICCIKIHLKNNFVYRSSPSPLVPFPIQILSKIPQFIYRFILYKKIFCFDEFTVFIMF